MTYVRPNLNCRLFFSNQIKFYVVLFLFLDKQTLYNQDYYVCLACFSYIINELPIHLVTEFTKDFV